MAKNFILFHAPYQILKNILVHRSHLIIFMTFCLFLFSCQKNTQTPTKNPQNHKKEEEAFPVELVKVTPKTMHLWLEQNALVESKEHASVKATSTGIIQSIKVEEGDEVKKGQLLLQIFQPTDKELLQKLQINLQKAISNEDRLKKMSAQGLSTQDEWLQAQFSLQQAQVELKQYQSEKSNQQIKAPISGVIAQKKIFLGESTAIGQLLFEIIDTTELLIPIKVPEKWAIQLQDGQLVRLFDREGHLVYDQAKIYRVAPMIDAQTGTIKIEIRLQHNEVPKLKIGTYLKAHILLGTHENVITVPKETLIYRGEKILVMTSINQKAKSIEVQLGYEEDGFVEIKPNPQINEETRVIRFGQQGLEDGSSIKEL